MGIIVDKHHLNGLVLYELTPIVIDYDLLADKMIQLSVLQNDQSILDGLQENFKRGLTSKREINLMIAKTVPHNHRFYYEVVIKRLAKIGRMLIPQGLAELYPLKMHIRELRDSNIPTICALDNYSISIDPEDQHQRCIILSTANISEGFHFHSLDEPFVRSDHILVIAKTFHH